MTTLATSTRTGVGLIAFLLPAPLVAAQDFELAGTQPQGSSAPLSAQILDLFTAPVDLGGGMGIGLACATCHTNPDQPRPMTTWQGSMMSQAARDPLFYAQLDLANSDDSVRPEVAGIGDLCLRCHAPVGWLEGRSGDHSGMGLEEKDTFGVQCHFCHRLVDPLAEGLAPTHFDVTEILSGLSPDPGVPPTYGSGMYVADPTHLRRGPFAGAVLLAHAGSVVPDDIAWSTGLNAYDHPVYDSPFHRNGNLCGTCHDVSLPFDCPDDTLTQDCFPIERTWTEWRYSDFYARGEGGNCQSCHMSGPLNGFGFGAVCDGGDPLGHLNDVHVHDLTGGNDFVPRVIRWMKERYDSRVDANFNTALEQLYPPGGSDPFEYVDLDALDAGRERVARTLARAAYLTAEVDAAAPLDLQVRVENRTGHKLPTGYPEGRRMWLNVRFYDPSGALLAESGRYEDASASLWHDQNLDAASGLESYDVVGYTDASGLELPSGRPTKVWEGRTKRAMGNIEFHFVLNDTWVMDNRIPPEAWDATQYAANRASPVIPAVYTTNGWQSDYLDPMGGAEHWEELAYPMPALTDRAEVALYYQTASREYIEELVADNPGTLTAAGYNRATLLEEAWENVGRSEPVEMARTVVAVVDADADGLPDGWESLHGLLGGFNDDPDADGRNNGQELRDGTDPNTADGELREPVDIVLVLDLSGSMNDPAPQSAIPKIELLRDAATLFLETWKDYAVPDDRIAVVTFETTASLLPATPALVSFTSEWTNVRTAVQGLSASGWTAMGAGLYRALELLNVLAPNMDSSRTRHVILFSNGMQNRSPIVASDSDYPTTNIEIRDPLVGDISVTGPSNPGLPVETGTLPRPSQKGAYIHTIGIGVGEDPGGTAWHQMLEEIADKHDGAHVFVTEAFQLEGTFLEELVQTLRGGTVEYVVREETALLPGAGADFEIPVNATATKFSAVVSWSRTNAAPPQLELERPDGVQENVAPLQRSGSFYRVVTRFLDDPDRHPEQFGVWKLRVTMPKEGRDDRDNPARTGATELRVHALLDDADLHYEFRFNGPELRVGQALRVTAVARQADRNLLHAEDVAVEVERPQRSVGAALAKARAPAAIAGLDPDLGARPLDLKLYSAFNDPSFTRGLRPITERYELTDDGQHGDDVPRDGRFTRHLFTPTVPGHYLLRFHMAMRAHDGTPVERVETRSLLVRPGPIVLDASDPRLALVAGRWYLDLTPADARGNVLGPGYGHRIRIVVAGLRLATEDRLDGSYRAGLPSGFERTAPVEIEVWNELVHSGPIPESRSTLTCVWILAALVVLLLAFLLLRRILR